MRFDWFYPREVQVNKYGKARITRKNEFSPQRFGKKFEKLEQFLLDRAFWDSELPHMTLFSDLFSKDLMLS